ncbi:MAG: wax ester/triacylglycerol synthase family O-acyltransferase [Steroidobacteraceae bacterium]
MTTTRHERMSTIDTAWLRMDTPGNSMMIVGVSATETPIRPAEFRRMVRQRLLCFDRFRQKAVADPLGASWVEDDDFDIDEHVKVVRLPGAGGKAELEALCAELAATPLDPSRPMWQLHLVERYLGGSAWITRVHHCYADGIAMIRVLLSMTEQDPAPAMGGRAKAASPGPRGARPDVLPVLSWIGRFTQPTGDILEHALAEGAKLLEAGIHQLFNPGRVSDLALQAGSMVGEFANVVTMTDDPPTPLRGPITGTKRVAWGEPIPLDEVKAVGRALGCTINDVLMSTVAGALGDWLRGGGHPTGGLKLRASVPVNLRAADEPLTLGNRFGLVFVEMAVGLEDPVERVTAMRETMTSLKGSMQPPMTLAVLGMLGMLPATLQAPAVELLSRKGSAVVSNVPGPQAPLLMCGQRITEMYFWVPQSGSIGVGISILSYAGRVYFGMISDDALVDEPAAVIARIRPNFDALKSAVAARGAAKKPARTKKPGRVQGPTARPPAAQRARPAAAAKAKKSAARGAKRTPAPRPKTPRRAK